MIIKLILIALFLVTGFMTYKYFFGISKKEEEEQAQNILLEGTEVDDGADLLEFEYEELINGKYDEALANINSALIKVKEKGQELVQEIASWEKRKEEWDQKKNDLKNLIDSSPDFANEEVRKAAEDLVKEGKKLRVEGKFLKEKAK